MALWALAAGSALGSVLQARGASSAAKAQSKAAGKAADASLTATRETNALNERMYNETVARQDPWLKAGRQSLQRLMGLQDDVPQFQPGNFEASPGYQFRLQEGENAIQRMLARQGMTHSGAALKAANDYAQGTASSEYGNWWNREIDQHNANVGTSNALYNRAAGIAGVGQNAANTLSAAGQQTAGAIGATNMQNAANVGNALQAGGAARASGYQGVAGAFNNALGSVGNIAGMAQAGYLGANPGWGIKPTFNPYTGAAY